MPSVGRAVAELAAGVPREHTHRHSRAFAVHDEAHRRVYDWDMVVEATCALSCTVTEFLAEAILKVLDGGKPFLLKSWFERIPRNGV